MDRSPGAKRGSPAPPPQDCVLRGRSGDRKALEELILRCQARVARFVIGETADAEHCEDICQGIFVKMVLALPRLRDPERFESWLFQIARNACRDHLRARRGWRRLFVSFDPQHENVGGETMADSDAAETIERGLARLPVEQRRLLQLSLDEKRSYEDLAKLSRSSLSSVKSRLWRARENLRELLLTGDPE